MKSGFFLIVLAGLLLAGCIGDKNNTERRVANEVQATNIGANLPPILQKGLEAHGGLARWQQMKALTFSFYREEAKELQQIALDSRKCRVERAGSFELGFDGDQVWVTPNKAAFGSGSPRFYHNLLFYFYAIPYVLADPGIKYEVVPTKIIKGKNYPGVKISYNDGVGDAPDDYYIAYFEEGSGELYLLLYTVTYYNGEPNEKFNALIYEEWTTVNGLKLPKKMAGYKFAADTLGEKRYERTFEDIKISETPFSDELFVRPAGAEIDSLMTH